MNTQAITLFYAGMLAQAIFLLLGQMSFKDAGILLICLAGSLAGFIPGKHEHHFDLSNHWFPVACIFAIAYAVFFKKKILEHIDKEILMVWTVVGLYTALQTPFIIEHPPLLILIAVLCLIAIANAFAGFDSAYGWQVYFYIWFLCILISLLVSQFAFSSMFSIFGHGSVPAEPFAMFVLGMSFLYLVANVWYVIELIPIPGKHQSLDERLEEVEEAMDDLVQDYDARSAPLWKTALLLGITVVLLAANCFGRFVNDATLVPILIAVLPALDRLKLFNRQPVTAAAAPVAPANAPEEP